MEDWWISIASLESELGGGRGGAGDEDGQPLRGISAEEMLIRHKI